MTRVACIIALQYTVAVYRVPANEDGTLRPDAIMESECLANAFFVTRTKELYEYFVGKAKIVSNPPLLDTHLRRM